MNAKEKLAICTAVTGILYILAKSVNEIAKAYHEYRKAQAIKTAI